MLPTTDQILNILSQALSIKENNAHEKIKNIKIIGKKISFDLIVNTPALHQKKQMETICLKTIQEQIGQDYFTDINFVVDVPSKKTENKTIPKIKHTIAIASGKGGVGKSTISANLAAGLAKKGLKVGLIDADIYGPSIPIMFDVQHVRPRITEKEGKNLILPVEKYGVKLLSIGFFTDTTQAVAWRGPMAAKALTQMFTDADWGDLDYLFIDLPPGTGDIHLTLVQSIPLTGVIVVSTPQNVALIDAQKAINMFQMPNINIPIIGMVENMAYFTPAELPQNKYYIFGKDGCKSLAQKMQIPLLAQIPLIQAICESGEEGIPAVLSDNNLYQSFFEKLTEELIKTQNLQKK